MRDLGFTVSQPRRVIPRYSRRRWAFSPRRVPNFNQEVPCPIRSSSFPPPARRWGAFRVRLRPGPRRPARRHRHQGRRRACRRRCQSCRRSADGQWCCSGRRDRPRRGRQRCTRLAAVSAGCAMTIHKICSSAMKATMLSHDGIAAGSCNVAVVGGMGVDDQRAPPAAEGRGGYRLGHGQLMDHVPRRPRRRLRPGNARPPDGHLRRGLRR